MLGDGRWRQLFDNEIQDYKILEYFFIFDAFKAKRS